MNVRPQDCQGHDVSVLPRGRAPEVVVQEIARRRVDHRTSLARRPGEMDVELVRRHERVTARETDRKSTRLNSSHANISYAVFCLKKKKESRSDRKRRAGPTARSSTWRG